MATTEQMVMVQTPPMRMVHTTPMEATDTPMEDITKPDTKTSTTAAPVQVVISTTIRDKGNMAEAVVAMIPRRIPRPSAISQ
jgi:hypothetical protein